MSQYCSNPAVSVGKAGLLPALQSRAGSWGRAQEPAPLAARCGQPGFAADPWPCPADSYTESRVTAAVFFLHIL